MLNAHQRSPSCIFVTRASIGYGVTLAFFSSFYVFFFLWFGTGKISLIKMYDTQRRFNSQLAFPSYMKGPIARFVCLNSANPIQSLPPFLTLQCQRFAPLYGPSCSHVPRRSGVAPLQRPIIWYYTCADCVVVGAETLSCALFQGEIIRTSAKDKAAESKQT